ncbi:13113_t:CDS:2, partial [Dentiscutata heterogama]
MSSKFLTDIAEDYKQLYETREDYDVIIYAGEEPNAEEVHAHSLVLRTRSTYFRGALASDWATKDKDSGCFIFKKPNVSLSSFELILKFLYCGEVDVQNLEGETILELLVASDEFGLTSLIDYILYFIENQKSFLEENPVGMLHMVARYETFNKIGNELKDNVTEFDQDDFKLLEKTLQRCIQYIRFHEISMPDFYHKKGATIVVARNQNSKQLIGGYTPIDWDMNSKNKHSTNSFIYSLSDPNNILDTRLGRISPSYYSYAMCCNSNNGPDFGGSLRLNGNYVYTNNNGYYPNVGIINGSQVEDYEVFQ